MANADPDQGRTIDAEAPPARTELTQFLDRMPSNRPMPAGIAAPDAAPGPAPVSSIARLAAAFGGRR
jgi:hypothetical protein